MLDSMEAPSKKSLLFRRLAVVALLLVWSSVGVTLFVKHAMVVAEAERNSRRLASEALNCLDEQFDLALLLSVEAYKKAKTEEARESLLEGLRRRPHLISFLRGHKDEVLCVAFSPNGTYLASGSADGAVHLWDLDTGQRVNFPESSHKGSTRGVVFSPDGNVLASGATDGSIILWDLREGGPSGMPLKAHSGIISLAFSPDGKTLASGHRDFSVVLWDVQNRKRVHSPLTGHRQYVNSLAFSPDGKTLASASWKIILWDVTTGHRMATLSEHRGILSSVVFSPDGNVLASGSLFDDTVMLWNVERKKSQGAPIIHGAGVTSVAFSPDGKIVASGGADGTIFLWVVESRQPLDSPLRGHDIRPRYVLTEPQFIDDGLGTLTSRRKPKQEYLVRSVAFSPDAKILASGGADNNVILWEVYRRSFSNQDSDLLSRACRIANRNLSYTEWKKYLPGEQCRKTCPHPPIDPECMEKEREAGM